MPSTLGRNLNLCFSKIKRQASAANQAAPGNQGRPFPSSATASILFKNFNSLYDQTFDNSVNNPKSISLPSSSSSSVFSDPAESENEPDFATVFASQRFFFTSPGSSNSIIESTPSIATPESSNSLASSVSSAATTAAAAAAASPLNQSNIDERQDQKREPLQSRGSPLPAVVENSVAIPTFSPDPFMDFRRSMQEMVEARDSFDVKANCDYLHELLLCYLALNPKSTHKFIIEAFADVLVSIMASTTLPPGEDGGRKSDQMAADGRRIQGQWARNV